MSIPADREQLLMRYLDGRLTKAESCDLSAWLREDASVRAWLREMAEQAVALGDLARERQFHAAMPVKPAGRIAVAQFPRVTWLALAAMLMLTGFLAAFWLTREGRAVVTVEEVAGALNWTGPTGGMRIGLGRGMKLPAGTFEAAGEGAMARLQFTDGTRVTLGGGTQAAVSDDGQRQVRLLAGSLAFEVVPQPPGRPLLVRTPAAMLEVLGTTFTVTTSADQTLVKVEEGRVRMRRLTDGSTVEVAGQQTAVVAVDQRAGLRAISGAAPPQRWRRTFEQPPLAHWKGEWHPAGGAEPAFVRAVPCVASQRADGMPVWQFGVTARGHGSHLVTLAPETIVHLRWRTAQPAALRVMLAVQKPDGRFGGNFETTLAADSAPAGLGGWRSASVPVSSFLPLLEKHPAPPERGQVSLLFVTTYEEPAGLEVAELSIEPLQP